MSDHDSISASGFPLAFKVRQGSSRPAVLGETSAEDVFVVEARQLAGHQKEIVVHEGASGSHWRLTSDEGAHLRGLDVAPFPLGYFNAGLHGDLAGRIVRAARVNQVPIANLALDLDNFYSMTGSFVRGDAQGHVEPAQCRVKIESSAAAEQVARVANQAVLASPAIAAMRDAVRNTFALYVNGKRRAVMSLPSSTAPDAHDPMKTYSAPPRPWPDANDLEDLIVKTGAQQEGMPQPASASPTGRVLRTVRGKSRSIDVRGVQQTESWLQLPGASHFTFKSDERAAIDARGGAGDQGPCGLALLSAGIAFCYMTQISRYIENMKLGIRATRLVQYNPYTLTGNAADGSLRGGIKPVDTHLFFHGDESDEVHEKLQRIAAHMCYLHVTLAAALETKVSIELNGRTIECLPA